MSLEMETISDDGKHEKDLLLQNSEGNQSLIHHKGIN
jgi:hypothetical protein